MKGKVPGEEKEIEKIAPDSDEKVRARAEG